VILEIGISERKMVNSKLIIVRGPPGSGKSTIAKIIGEKLAGKSIVFSKDSFLIGVNFMNTDSKEAQREIVKLIIIYYLRKKYNVVIDGLFGGKDGAKKLDGLKSLAIKNKSDFYVINLNCSLKDSFSRILTRKGHIVPGKFSRKEIIKWYKYFYQTKYDKGIEINTEELNLDETVKLILEKIRGRN